MFFKKKSIAKVIDSHLVASYRLLKTSGNDNWKSLSLDLEPLMYVISDLAVIYAGKNRSKTSDEVLNCIFSKYRGCTDFQTAKDRFFSRIDFYTEVVNGKILHCHCAPGILPKIDDDPITRCAVAFTDCLLNPAYVNDYDGASAPMFDVFSTFAIFEKFTMPFALELSYFAKDMQKSAK